VPLSLSSRGSGSDRGTPRYSRKTGSDSLTKEVARDSPATLPGSQRHTRLQDAALETRGPHRNRAAPTSRTRDTFPRPERLCETWPRSDDSERATLLLGGALETRERRFARSLAFHDPRARSVLERDALGTCETLHPPGRAANFPRASPAATSSLLGMRMALCDFQRCFLRRRAPPWRKKAPSQFIGRSYRVQSEAIGSNARLSNPARGYRTQSDISIFSACFCFKTTRQRTGRTHRGATGPRPFPSVAL
jgi:hypothetical protein